MNLQEVPPDDNNAVNIAKYSQTIINFIEKRFPTIRVGKSVHHSQNGAIHIRSESRLEENE